MQTRTIILQVLALFLLVIIRSAIRFDRHGDNHGKNGVADSVAPVDVTGGVPDAPREQNDLADHSG